MGSLSGQTAANKRCGNPEKKASHHCLCLVFSLPAWLKHCISLRYHVSHQPHILIT